MGIEEQQRLHRSLAAAVELSLEMAGQNTGGEVKVDPSLVPEAAERALQILTDQDSGFQGLVRRLEEAGQWRAATQLLVDAGETTAATRAHEKFKEVWGESLKDAPVDKLSAVARFHRSLGGEGAMALASLSQPGSTGLEPGASTAPAS